MLVTIHVTHEDIQNGHAFCGFDDAIATALRRQCPGSNPIVGRDKILFQIGVAWVQGKLPARVQTLVRRLQNNLSVPPFRFSMPVSEIGGMEIPLDLMEVWIGEGSGKLPWPHRVHNLRRRLADGV